MSQNSVRVNFLGFKTTKMILRTGNWNPAEKLRRQLVHRWRPSQSKLIPERTSQLHRKSLAMALGHRLNAIEVPPFVNGTPRDPHRARYTVYLLIEKVIQTY